MNDHLTPEQVAACASGELPVGDLDAARAHLNHCLTCANLAVDEWLIKSAIGRSGNRFEAPAGFRDHMAAVVASETSKLNKKTPGRDDAVLSRPMAWPALARWTAAVLVVLALAGWATWEYRARNVYTARVTGGAEIAEACDLHIAALAATQLPQVVSSDRHTVKPWFQGKLPFSFNIPATLPEGTTLDGANLAYLDNHPVAQLLFSIDRHRVSVFVQEKSSAAARGQFAVSRAGFQVAAFDTGDLELLAVSDVEPSRLQALGKDMQAAQAHH